MKNEDHRLCQLKYKLKKLKDRRVRTVIWRLTSEERQYIENLGYKVTPYLYEIRTKTFKNFYEITDYRIKEIHRLSKRGKKTTVTKLNRNDMMVLEEFNVRFRPVKFEIKLVS